MTPNLSRKKESSSTQKYSSSLISGVATSSILRRKPMPRWISIATGISVIAGVAGIVFRSALS